MYVCLYIYVCMYVCTYAITNTPIAMVTVHSITAGLKGPTQNHTRTYTQRSLKSRQSTQTQPKSIKMRVECTVLAAFWLAVVTGGAVGNPPDSCCPSLFKVDPNPPE